MLCVPEILVLLTPRPPNKEMLVCSLFGRISVTNSIGEKVVFAVVDMRNPEFYGYQYLAMQLCMWVVVIVVIYYILL